MDVPQPEHEPEAISYRFMQRQATVKTVPMHSEVRKEFIKLAKILEIMLPNGRAKSIALTELENASMWANKAVSELAPLFPSDEEN